MLASHQYRTAPLPAHGNALDDAQQNQQHRRHGADLRIGGQQADAHRHHPHHHQGDHQRFLAPDTVANMTKDNAAQRPGEKAHGEGAEGGHGAEQLVVRGKEQGPEHQRRSRGVDVKVVPLDHRADKGGGRSPAWLGRSGRLHGSGSFDYFSGRRERCVRGALVSPV
ncbi:hypothetical protein D3C77_521410 [compost metagenome]